MSSLLPSSPTAALNCSIISVKSPSASTINGMAISASAKAKSESRYFKNKFFSFKIIFHCLNFFSKTLQPLTFEKSPSLRHENLLHEKIEFEKFLAIPCLVKGWLVDHITLILIEKMTDGSYHLEFFDSKGYPIWMIDILPSINGGDSYGVQLITLTHFGGFLLHRAA